MREDTKEQSREEKPTPPELPAASFVGTGLLCLFGFVTSSVDQHQQSRARAQLNIMHEEPFIAKDGAEAKGVRPIGSHLIRCRGANVKDAMPKRGEKAPTGVGRAQKLKVNWALQDSNLRPPACRAGALAN